MIIKEFGKKNKDVVILLHGGGLSWWNYKDVSELLKEKYHVILPILDGHSGSDKDFISIEENAKEIIEFIDNNYKGHVKLISGLSLGGQILLVILSIREKICDFAIIESALVYKMKITNKLIAPSIKMSHFLINKLWFSKLQFNSLKIKEDLFNYYYEDTKKLTTKNMISFMKANTNYTIKNELSNCKSRVLIVAGRKEKQIMIKSAFKIHEMLPNSKIEIIESYYHGDLSINHADNFVKIVNELIGG